AQVRLAAIDADVGTFTHVVDVALVDGDGAAVVHADLHAVGVARNVLLDRVAGQGTGCGTCNGRGVLATLALVVGQFTARDCTDQTADHGAGGIGHIAAAADLLDTHDGAAILTAALVAVGRLGVVSATRTVAGRRDTTGHGERRSRDNGGDD